MSTTTFTAVIAVLAIICLSLAIMEFRFSLNEPKKSNTHKLRILAYYFLGYHGIFFTILALVSGGVINVNV